MRCCKKRCILTHLDPFVREVLPELDHVVYARGRGAVAVGRGLLGLREALGDHVAHGGNGVVGVAGTEVEGFCLMGGNDGENRSRLGADKMNKTWT